MGGHAMRILVVDDDGDILDLLKYNFEREGFKVKTLEKSDKAISVATKFLPDLIILDVMMPQVNGLDLCSRLRNIERFANTYIFFLTARSGSQHQQAALDTGGDDYVEKVMGLRALIYKVNSVLKSRFIIRKRMQLVKAGDLVVDRRKHAAVLGNEVVNLNNDEFELLYFFAQNSEKAISIETMVRNIWGSEIYLLDTSVELYIHSLRRKLGKDIIQSLQRNYYKLNVKQ